MQYRLSSHVQEEKLPSKERHHTERIPLSEIGRILDDEIQRLPAAQRSVAAK
jgi:hypothetical protein